MSGKRLIINADDLGYDPAITRGIFQCIEQGIVSSTTFMVNTPFSEDAAAQAKGKAIGLHLNLARHPPTWSRFPPEHLENGELAEQNAARLPEEVVEQEALAQLDRLEKLCGAPATHLDVHKHLHRHPNVRAGLLAAAARRQLPVRSLDDAMRTVFRHGAVRTNDHFLGDAGKEPYWSSTRLRQELEKLEDGVTELMCHPGYLPEKVRTGYGPQREVELQTFLHPSSKKLLERLGIALVDWRAVGTG